MIFLCSLSLQSCLCCWCYTKNQVSSSGPMNGTSIQCKNHEPGNLITDRSLRKYSDWEEKDSLQSAYMLKTHYRSGHHHVSNFEVENIVTIHMKLKFLCSAQNQAVYIYSIRPDNGPDIFKDSCRPTAAVPRLSEGCFEVSCERSGGSEDQQQQDAAEPNSYKLTLIKSLTCFHYVNAKLWTCSGSSLSDVKGSYRKEEWSGQSVFLPMSFAKETPSNAAEEAAYPSNIVSGCYC